MKWWNPTDWTGDAWAAIAAWGTLVVALAAAWFARHQVLEARRTREEQSQPFIVVDFEPSEAWSGIIDLVIRNTGTTLARDVKIDFDPPLKSAYFSQQPNDSYDIMQANIIRHGIPAMPPGREYRILFERMPDRFESALPRSYNAQVNFSGTRGPMEPLTYRLDLDIYFGTKSVMIYGIHEAAKALREINERTKDWTAHSNGLRVYGRNEDAIVETERWTFEDFTGSRRSDDATSGPAPSDDDNSD